MGAKAFTAGRNIVFGSRVENPESGENSLLFAHELAHVVQQGRSSTSIVEPHSPAASLSAAPGGQVQTSPTVTAVNVPAPAELGVGRDIAVTAVVAAGAPPLTWTLVGAPAGVAVAPAGGLGARIQAAPGAIAGPAILVASLVRDGRSTDLLSSINGQMGVTRMEREAHSKIRYPVE
jgi:hypothetical protein